MTEQTPPVDIIGALERTTLITDGGTEGRGRTVVGYLDREAAAKAVEAFRGARQDNPSGSLHLVAVMTDGGASKGGAVASGYVPAEQAKEAIEKLLELRAL